MSNTLTSFSNNYSNIINIAKLSLLVGNINSYKLNTEEVNKKLNPYLKKREDTFRCQIVNNIKSLYSLATYDYQTRSVRIGEYSRRANSWYKWGDDTISVEEYNRVFHKFFYHPACNWHDGYINSREKITCTKKSFVDNRNDENSYSSWIKIENYDEQVFYGEHLGTGFHGNSHEPFEKYY